MSQAVKEMFARIAPKYDLANDVLSFGTHRLWRKKLLKLIQVRPTSVLDVCTGTGDLAHALDRHFQGEASISGVDFVPEMIELAKAKYDSVDFRVGDAMKLEFPEASFDLLTISFGIRNVDSPKDSLKEFLRVLKPDGQLLVLEFGQASLPGFKQAFDFYSKHIMPRVGGFISGDRAAYEYLPETSKAFPCRSEFTQIMADAGFEKPSWRSLNGGIAYIYSGRKNPST